MRTLIVAALVALSVSAAQAQAPAQDTNDRALPAPSARLIDQLKAAGELKDQKQLEAPAPKLDSIDTRPADPQPGVAKPAEIPAAASAPAASAAAPVAPAASTTTTAAKPAETKPAEVATGVKPVKTRVARKRETNEHKARRIAAKYGVHW
jgi:hypothetical protein